MTILENIQNSQEFPPGILGTVDSREVPNWNSQWPCKLSNEDIAEIGGPRDVAMATNFGTKIAITGFL